MQVSVFLAVPVCDEEFRGQDGAVCESVVEQLLAATNLLLLAEVD
jgi:hypothetical protein